MTITKKEVEAILNTLESIEVKGFDNMNKMMALIQFFKSKEQPQEVESEGDNG